MKRTLIITLVLTVFAAGAFAQQHRPMMNHGPRGQQCDGKPGFGPDRGRGEQMKIGLLLKHADDLKLDENQKKEFLKMQEAFGTERIDLKADLEKAQLTLTNLRLSEASDNEVLNAMDKVGDLKTEMRKMSYMHRQQVKNLLTDEQIEMIKQYRKERIHSRLGCTPDKQSGQKGERGSSRNPGWHH